MTLGIGMCMVMVWEDMLIGGIIVGLVGIVLLLLAAAGLQRVEVNSEVWNGSDAE